MASADHSNMLPKFDPAKKGDYMLTRDHAAGARLNLQHYLMRECVGYALHPDIPIKPDMKIADIATGTGIWILDVSLRLPESVQFEGFDISADQFPPASSLPDTIRFFGDLDASDAIPDHLVGKFDVVHVGFLISIIRGNFSQWAQNLMRMLKPGGYLQWNDGDGTDYIERFSKITYDREQYPAFATLKELSLSRASETSKMMGWAHSLDDELTREGFEEVQFRRVVPPMRFSRALSENSLLLVEETAKQTGSKEALALAGKCSEELKKGALYTGMYPVVAIGRKPL